MIKRKELGDKGEDLAANFLEKNGYQIIERNYQVRMGEIDIVAREGKSIVFIEVKVRSSSDFGLPEEALSYEKRRRLTRLASGYLARYRIKNKDCRFDVVSILMDKDKVEDIRLIKNAFEAVS